MATFACPCGRTVCGTADTDDEGHPLDPAPQPLDADGGLARCHECGQRVAVVS